MSSVSSRDAQESNREERIADRGRSYLQAGKLVLMAELPQQSTQRPAGASASGAERCPTCGRPRSACDSNSLCTPIVECASHGDDVCILVAQRNTLIACLRRALARPGPDAATLRSIGAVLEDILPSPAWCPRCHRADVVISGVVTVHLSGGRTCGASAKFVLGGIEVDR